MPTEVHVFGDYSHVVIECDEAPVGPYIRRRVPAWWALALIGGPRG